MSVKAVRWMMAAYLALFLAMTTWPGAIVINSVRPLVLGLPFNLFALAILILAGLGLLTVLYFSEKRTQR